MISWIYAYENENIYENVFISRNFIAFINAHETFLKDCLEILICFFIFFQEYFEE